MADEGGDMLETRRRSVRIWALEEEKKKKKTTTTTTTVGDKQQKASVTNSNPLLTAGNETVSVAAFKTSSIAGVPHFQHTQVQEDQHKEQQHARPPTFKQYDRRRVKRKRLEDVVVSSPAYFSPAQEGENDPKHGSTSIRNDHRASSSSLQRLPEKRVLEFVIDILQRRDTYEIFAQPVDPEEVEGYYRIIKEPMDFGTMRAKLQEGMYTSLEQFEHDVFLISNNAMHFNSSTTVFYREARSIQELAQRVFHALKTDPENFVLEFSLTKKRPGRKPQGEAAGPSTKRARYGKVNIGAAPRRNTKTERLFDLNSHFEQRQNKIPSGSGTGFGTERRQTYKPPRENESIFSSQYDLPKPLIHIIDGELGYKESLMEFVKDLGPTAQMVANRKLEKYRQIEASNSQFQAQAPSTSSTPSWLVPPPSLTLAPNYLDGVNNGEIPQSILHNLPGDYLDDANKRLDGHGDVFKGENAQTSCGINTHDAAYKGKMVCTDSRMDMDNTFFRGMVPSSDIMGTSGDLRRVNPHFSTIKAVKIASPEVAASNTRGNIDIFGSSKGKQICTDESMNLLHGNDRYDTTHQNQYGEMWYGSHFPLSGIENTNTPVGDGITNTCDKYQTIDMMAEFNQPRNQMQPDELANVLHSRLQELMSGNSSVLTSQAPKVSVQDTTFLNRLGSQEEGRVNREQAAPSLEWPRSTTPQTSRGFPSVQMQLNKNRLVGRSTILRERTPHLRASQLVAAQKMAVLHAMSFYDKATPESHQAEDSQRQSSSDNSKQLDLALQL